MKSHKLLLAAAVAAVMASCGKDDAKPEGNASEIQGTYDFVGMSVAGISTVTVPESNEKTITYNAYKTKENVGSLVVDASKFVSTAMGYSIDTTVKSEYYDEGLLEDTYELPFKVTIPPAGSNATYKLVGTDSIHFDKGFITVPDDPNMGGATQESGARITWKGDTLVMRSVFSATTTRLQSGFTVITVFNSVQEVRLKKRK